MNQISNYNFKTKKELNDNFLNNFVHNSLLNQDDKSPCKYERHIREDETI